ncbi:hypothetical protein Tco_0711314 [Tanacetum coccineum]
MVYVVNGVLASGVDMVLEKDFAGFALQEMEIHPLMLLIQNLSMILQTFSPTLYNPSNGYLRKGQKLSQNGQNRARNGKSVKSKVNPGIRP